MGMKARLGFSIATAITPDILLLDEVLGTGDQEFRAKSQLRIRELMTQAKAIVMVTHDLTYVTEFCNRAVLLEQGRLVHDGAPDETVALYRERVAKKKLLAAGTSRAIRGRRRARRRPCLSACARRISGEERPQRGAEGQGAAPVDEDLRLAVDPPGDGDEDPGRAGPACTVFATTARTSACSTWTFWASTPRTSSLPDRGLAGHDAARPPPSRPRRGSRRSRRRRRDGP